MIKYKLLTPGPLTTTETVKKEMLVDHCTWDDDYKQITQKIRKTLLELAHVSDKEYTAVLMQGSGTFGVESVLTSTVGTDCRQWFLWNAYDRYRKKGRSLSSGYQLQLQSGT